MKLDHIHYLMKNFGLVNACKAAMAWATGGNTEIQIKGRGDSSRLRLRYPSSDLDVFNQVFLDGDYEFDTVDEPSVIVDAGANIGLASVFFARRFPACQVIALEPEVKNFELLLDNTRAYPNIRPIRAALWSHGNGVRLIDPRRGSWAFQTTDGRGASGASTGDPVMVDSMTVDDILNLFKVPRIDILKIDIEGAEAAVFEGAGSWIDRVDCIIIELHDSIVQGCSTMVRGQTSAFEDEWSRGENVYFARSSGIVKRGR